MKIRLILLAIATIEILLISACSGTTVTVSTTPSSNDELATHTPNFSPTTIKKLSLVDSSSILNLLPLLPDSFEKVDAASEGLSNKDMGLGSDYTEVELFLSEEPFQIIYGFYGIIESRLERASSDALFKDEDQITELLVQSITEGIEEENLDASYAQTSITYPDIADLAVYGEGQIESYGVYVGCDVLFFKTNKVYVFLYSVYYDSDRVSLEKIAEEITHRIGMYSQ